MIVNHEMSLLAVFILNTVRSIKQQRWVEISYILFKHIILLRVVFIRYFLCSNTYF